MQAGEASLLSSFSPSFSSYSSGKFAEIAARVVEEFRKETDSDSNIFDWKTDSTAACAEPEEFNQGPQDVGNGGIETVVGEIGDDEFEFAVVPREPMAVTISAEDIFYNGQIKPIYPIFNTNLLSNGDSNVNGEEDDDGGGLKKSKSKPKRVHRPSLGKLMSEERETNSCSSSEADELDAILPGTYCVWTPKESLERCKKSNSMGSSKRWKLRDLLYRSNSDGKETFVFIASSKRDEKIADVSKEIRGSTDTGDEKIAGKVKSSRVAAAAAAVTVADEGKCVKNTSNGAEKKNQSTPIPYRQEMVELFNNVINGKNKNSHQL